MTTATTTYRPAIQAFRDDWGTNWEIRNGAEILYQAIDLRDAKNMLMELHGTKSVAEAMDVIYGGQEDEYIEDEDGSLAFARMLERKAEAGTWFDQDPY